MEKYFLQNDTTGYLVQIFEKDFNGTSTEIFGNISIEKGSVDNILDTIRGTGLKLQLEASIDRNFDEFSEAEDEKKYTVKVTKSGQTVFNGFLKPDGITQSFVRDIWIVSLDFMDGLGSLKDLAFVKLDGFNFTGKMSVYEVISGCLARTGIVMTINSNIDVHYLDYAGTNILKDTYINADRFFKIDAQKTAGGTTMTCDEVIKSVLNLFSACITQQDGYWWVYRPNDIKPNVTFTDNTLNTTFVKNLYKKVGSQIDNYYPHHANGNQQIETKGAISAYRLNYKYGFKAGVLLNGKLNHDLFLDYENWDKTILLEGNEIVNDPLDNSGLIMKTYPFTYFPLNLPQPPPRIDILKSTPYGVLLGAQIDVVFNLKNDLKRIPTFFYFKIKRSDGFWLDNNGDWFSSEKILEKVVTGGANEVWTIKCKPVDANCDIEIILMTPKTKTIPNLTTAPYIPYNSEIESVEIINNYNFDGRVGEFHTVTRLVSPSSIVKENQEVYNGDSLGDIFQGAIYKSDKETLTTLWTRTGFLEEKYLLQISAEDDLRIQQKPIKKFTGDFYGEIPYLSIIEINNLSGLFMFIEHSYDTETNITSGKLLQYYTNDVTDLQYLLSYDYGNTVKPSIKS